MRNLLPIIFVLLISITAWAEVGTTVYLSEPNLILEPVSVSDTLIEYPQVMVGTRLAIVVDSNEGERWNGGLFVEGSYMYYGVLSGRDYNDATYDWEGSHLPDVSIWARVKDSYGFEKGEGFDLFGHRQSEPGKWFVIDYTALKPGPCRVSFYYYDYYLGEEFLIYELEFINIPSRDFDGDKSVGLSDYAYMADCWLWTVTGDEDPCARVDLNSDTIINFIDLAMFASLWLEKTEY